MFQIVHGAFFVIKNCAQTRAEQSSCNFCITFSDFGLIFFNSNNARNINNEYYLSNIIVSRLFARALLVVLLFFVRYLMSQSCLSIHFLAVHSNE